MRFNLDGRDDEPTAFGRSSDRTFKNPLHQEDSIDVSTLARLITAA